MDKPVIILGAGGLGKAAQEIFESHDIVTYCFLDDDKKLHGTEINMISVLGNTDDDGFLKYIGQKCEAFVAVDENAYRRTLVKMLNERRKVMPVNATHKLAAIASSAVMGHGNMLNAGAVLGAGASIGSHCILHSRSIVDYDAKLGDYVQVGAGAVVASGVEVGDKVFIGAGATIISGVSIGKGARIGAGSVVVSDVLAGKTMFGNPAQEVKR